MKAFNQSLNEVGDSPLSSDGPWLSAQKHLPLPLFATVVAHAPLIAIDLVVLRETEAEPEVLLGLRNNRPAQGYWFVPGGRIHKGEPLQAAMQRTVQAELGLSLEALAQQAGLPVVPHWLGVYEHFYADSFPDPATPTHYVVLAHTVQWPAGLALPALAAEPGQHSKWQWWPLAQAAHSPQVHPHTQAYVHALRGAALSRSASTLAPPLF